MTAQIDTETASDGTTDAPDSPSDESDSGRQGRLGAFLPRRREAIFLLGGGLLGATLSGAGAAFTLRPPGETTRDDTAELSSRDGRDLLEAGNVRYVAGNSIHPDQSVERRSGLAEGQAPFAVILSCADSRVPPEVIFDQGLGDLFVVRSAGQVLDHAVLGSIQYGVEHLGVPLLVVLGHSGCGAVQATITAIEKKAKASGTDIDSLVASIRPAVLEAEETGADETNLLSVSVDINVERTVERLKTEAVLKDASTLRRVKIIGAVYSLDTGLVNWL